MINWLANRVATVLQRRESDALKAALAELKAERETAGRETRALISEVEDVLEKFQRMTARLAMRRSREAKHALDAESPGGDAPATAAPARLSAQERKQLLRQQIFSRGGRLPPNTREA